MDPLESWIFLSATGARPASATQPLATRKSKPRWPQKLSVVASWSGNRTSSAHPPAGEGELPGLTALVVAYALAGTVNIDLTKDPVGQTKDGKR